MKRHKMAMAASVGAYDDGPIGAVATQAQTAAYEKTRDTSPASSEAGFVPASVSIREHTLILTGELDSSSAHALEAEIERLCEEGRHQHHAGPSRAEVHRSGRSRRDRVPLPAVPAARIRVRADPRRTDDPPRVRAGRCGRTAAVPGGRRRPSSARRTPPLRTRLRRWCSATARTVGASYEQCPRFVVGHWARVVSVPNDRTAHGHT